jgi:hypothetical protein
MVTLQPEMPLLGGCGCGAVRYEVTAPLQSANYCHCGDCGSALFSRDPHDPERMSIRMGTFDGDPGIRPSARSFVTYAAPWETIPDDGLPRHGESAHAQ